MVSEWPPTCLNKLLPRGHQSSNLRKSRMKTVPTYLIIALNNPIQFVLNIHGFCLCHQTILRHKQKKKTIGTGHRAKNGKYSRVKSIISNRIVNRDCHQLTVDHTSADSAENGKYTCTLNIAVNNSLTRIVFFVYACAIFQTLKTYLNVTLWPSDDTWVAWSGSTMA